MSDKPAWMTATVTDVRLESRAGGVSRWQLLLSPGALKAGERGEIQAVSRSGARLVVSVLEVVAGDDGSAWHVVDKPLLEGTVVQVRALAWA